MPQTTTIQRLDRLIHQLVRVRNRVSQDHMTDFELSDVLGQCEVGTQALVDELDDQLKESGDE